MNSELRQDPVSGDWIVIAPARAKRPEQILKKEKRIKAPKKNCPFENFQKSGHGEPVLIYPSKKNWQVQIIANKYPAFIHRKICAEIFKKGPYLLAEAIGHHDLVISRAHHENFPHLSVNSARLIFEAFQSRYDSLSKDKCLAYVSIFHNWGSKAGASIYHPHYQIIALPIIPPSIQHSLDGSEIYFGKNKKCVHCAMIDWEKKEKKRLIYENKGAIVFAPFVSQEPFELRVFPKKHLSYFEDTSVKDMEFVVDALQNALIKIERKLKDPDYNFFIHTSPLKNKKTRRHYHWHIEILPKISVSAGFELGTGIEITAVDPDEAAKILKR
ncbi:MAG: Galactose-1-phosphate uridylyltransferase [Candidatus Curtissbacteria bacterium GW2011_GWA1_40_24]|uniref:Galactose-1-phosphate uridylyltransferase n=2 Tax=Patescibacteria group TaxID=1783273 RepID=A0A0G0U8C9_9BACT|nr:MAG: Galactose-1-phosphate uridylyltransferase [Candidatus Curtissbacteria bacterium GW2011_GWA1_40_24]KKR89065.1 MAG: Galactose-1-phosphate uridylyltransferase [Candidatus Wolfebacteria bacterium GW2011_GWB1_41_12]